MKKLKLLVSSLIAMLAFAIFAVTGIKVHAATTFYTASMTGESGAATTFNDGDEIIKDSNLKLEIIGCTAVESARSLSSFSVALAAGGNGGSSKYFKFTSLSTSDMNVTVYFADYNSDGSKMQAKSYTFGSKTGTTTKALNTETDKLDSKENIMLYSAGRCNLFKVEYEIIEVDESVYTATFALNGGSGTQPTDITVSVDADDKTITLPTTTATKAKYSFGGWSDGTNTYQAGASYTLSSNVEFEAVWTLSVAYGDNLVLNATDLTVGFEDNIIDGTIYCFTSSLEIDSNNKSIDGHSFTKRIKLSGAGSKTSTSILVKAPSHGTLKVYGMSGSKNSSRILGLYDSNYSTVDVTGFENDGNAIGSYEYTISAAGDYYLGSVESGFNVYYVQFIPAPTVTAGIVTGVDSDNKTAVAFIAKIENVTDVTSLTDMKFNLVATYKGVEKEYEYAVTTCYTALTTFGNDDISGYGSSNNTYYVYFVVSGIDSTYDGLTLDVTFNASYNDVELTQTISYTYPENSQA